MYGLVVERKKISKKYLNVQTSHCICSMVPMNLLEAMVVINLHLFENINIVVKPRRKKTE